MFEACKRINAYFKSSASGSIIKELFGLDLVISFAKS